MYMKISDEGLKLIKVSEGFMDHIYKDVSGYDTVGYGHLLTEEDKRLNRFVGGMTEAEGTELLRSDVGKAESAVNDLVNVPLTQGQFDALVDFTFNLGRGALSRSTLLKKLNAKDYAAVPTELMKWNKSRDPKTGKIVPFAGLTRRRKREVDLWNKT